MSVEIVPLGDSAITITFGNEISEHVHQQINQFLHIFRQSKIDGVIECAPAYTSVSIFYNPVIVTYSQLEKKVYSIYQSAMETPKIDSIVYRIPVYYGGETGPDLPFIAEYSNCTEQEVIDLHANKEYLIHMIGFVPGFPYLGGLAKKIAAPRLETPRAKIAAGSVGIGGDQTGIYPAEVPSGWRIIGITPLPLFNLENEKPSLLSAGNYISFFPVEYEEYFSIKEQAAAKKYEVLTYKKGE
ncbi:inhibitor of KinA [Neobacillus niacini]|uniref:5-oxoprolinase subunit PxpB n=1 Tax=Neobacillus niacini TaxID=86668 RepID=UPI0010468B2E|nr:5-oxoprolinase subunit PxpB [Neobacillus niacini]MDR7077657.1 inhibitor of KinA [Neobacillus niacini]